MRRYETAIPGRRVAGLPMNDAYFLPEDRDDVRVEPIDPADAQTVARVLALEPSPEPRPPVSRLRVASRDEVDAHWHGAPATEAMYRGSLELRDDVPPFVAGEERGVVVRVVNQGTHTWPPGGVGWPAIGVTYRWLDGDGEIVVADGLRTPLPAALPPGRRLLVSADVLAPSVSGRHVLVLDLLHEHVRWFGRELTVPVEVRHALCLAILGEDDLAAAAAAALAQVAPAVRPLLLTASPERTTEGRGYAAASDARTYVLGKGGTGRVRAGLGAVARATALVADAGLERLGARPRLAAPAGVAFLEALGEAGGLLVVARAHPPGEREALQERAAMLAARTLGLETIRVRSGAGDLAHEVAAAVATLEARGT